MALLRARKRRCCVPDGCGYNPELAGSGIRGEQKSGTSDRGWRESRVFKHFQRSLPKEPPLCHALHANRFLSLQNVPPPQYILRLQSAAAAQQRIQKRKKKVSSGAGGELMRLTPPPPRTRQKTAAHRGTNKKDAPKPGRGKAWAWGRRRPRSSPEIVPQERREAVGEGHSLQGAPWLVREIKFEIRRQQSYQRS